MALLDVMLQFHVILYILQLLLYTSYIFLYIGIVLRFYGLFVLKIKDKRRCCSLTCIAAGIVFNNIVHVC